MSKQKTRLISDHAPGLGQAITQTFEAAGYALVSVSRSGVWATDLRDPHAMAALFDKLGRERRPLVGVVHKAMQIHIQDFLSTTAESLQYLQLFKQFKNSWPHGLDVRPMAA